MPVQHSETVKLPINPAAEDPEQEMNQTNKTHRGFKEDQAKKQIETDKENEDDDVDQDEQLFVIQAWCAPALSKIGGHTQTTF